MMLGVHLWIRLESNLHGDMSDADDCTEVSLLEPGLMTILPDYISA
jgi:hypothetical protein